MIIAILDVIVKNVQKINTVMTVVLVLFDKKQLHILTIM